MDSSLLKEVEALLDEVNKTHRYSMSRIYGLYNRVFEANETPQSCASCLIRKVRELNTWLDIEKKKPVEPIEPVQAASDIENNETLADDSAKKNVVNKPKRGRKRR